MKTEKLNRVPEKSTGVINMGILAHVDAGKTTLTESLLYCGGAISSLGKVDDGTTNTDSMPLEKQRGITIRSSATSFFWNDTKINLIDTPGHVDFVAEVERALGILDCAVLLISAKEGIQAQTRVLFYSLQKLKIPTIFYINKIDRAGVKIEEIHAQIKELLTPNAAILQSIESNDMQKLEDYGPIRELLLNMDDALAEKYILDENIDENEYLQAFYKYIRECKLFPVLRGSSLKGIGTDFLLDAVGKYFSPTKNDSNILRAKVFKIDRDEHNKKRAFLKVESGKIECRRSIPVVGRSDSFKINNLCKIENGAIVPAESAPSGDIAIVLNAGNLKTGDTLGEESPERDVKIAKPSLQAALKLADQKFRSSLLQALEILSEEDPFLSYEINDWSGEISVRVFGEVQLEIIRDFLRTRFSIPADFGPLTVIFRERPLQAAEGLFPMYVPQNNPYCATVGLRIEPLPIGSGLEFESRVSLGSINNSFQNGVREGVEKACRRGLYGWEITDLKVIFIRGAYFSPVSTPADFRNLTPYVFEQALKKAGTSLLQPFVAYELRVPIENSGQTAADLRQMRAIIHEMKNHKAETLFSGRMPETAANQYAPKLIANTNGRGVFYKSPDGCGDYQGPCEHCPFARNIADDKVRNMFIKAGMI